MNNKRRPPFVMTDIVVLGLSAPAVPLVRRRHTQMHRDVGGSRCF
mgnify:CR=1 FL=1|jgi:hypothetical protein